MATISASSQQLVKHKPNNESAELDADIMSQSCFSMSMNYDVVKYMLPSGKSAFFLFVGNVWK